MEPIQYGADHPPLLERHEQCDITPATLAVHCHHRLHCGRVQPTPCPALGYLGPRIGAEHSAHLVLAAHPSLAL